MYNLSITIHTTAISTTADTTTTISTATAEEGWRITMVTDTLISN